MASCCDPLREADVPQGVSLSPEVNWCWHLPSEMKTYCINVRYVSHQRRYPTRKKAPFIDSIHMTEWATGRICFPIVVSHWGKGNLHLLIDISHVNLHSVHQWEKGLQNFLNLIFHKIRNKPYLIMCCYHYSSFFLLLLFLRLLFWLFRYNHPNIFSYAEQWRKIKCPWFHDMLLWK